MSNDAFNSFKSWAAVLLKEDGVNYAEKGSAVITLMADRYVEALDAGDQRKMDKYISGLMLRFWSSIGKTMMKSTGLQQEYDDYVSWLYEAIAYACKYRAWQNPEKHVNAQQAINQCIETIRHQHYYEFNLDKHRANFNAVSMDSEINDCLDSNGKATLADTLADEADLDWQASSAAGDYAHDLVQSYINRKKIVEAIILDTIAFNDVNRVVRKPVENIMEDGTKKKQIQVYKEFWPFRCVQILSKLPTTYPDYFNHTYRVNQVELDKAFEAIQKANNQRLYKYLRSTLEDARKVFIR